MKISLEINNATNSPIKDGFFESVAKKTFAELNYDFLEGKKIEISLALITPEEMRKLNREYRKYDKVTDILSFPEYQNIKEIKMAASKKTEKEIFLGELILCYDYIKEYANKEKLDLNGELSNIIAHGVLHLLGFLHGEKMFAIQTKVKDTLI